MARRSNCLMAVWFTFAAVSCANGTADTAQVTPTPDGAMFGRDVYPLLLRDCAFSTCHGKDERFFRIVGPGRVRLDPSSKPEDPATLPELLMTYERARDMLATDARAQDSLLLRKPLEASAGGQGHLGADDFGRNVYASQADPRYALLLRWAMSVGPAPTQADLVATP